MSIFGRILGVDRLANTPPTPKRGDPTDDFWFSGAPVSRTAAKINVSVELARQVPVVRDSIAVLSQSTASLSTGVFQWVSHEERQRLSDHPVAKLMANPNPRQTSYDFVNTMVEDLASWGYFLARKHWDDGPDFPSRLDRIDPARVSLIEVLPDGDLRFKYYDHGNRMVTLLEEEVWYIPVPPTIGDMIGRSAILHDGREAIAAIIGLQEYANSFWGNDATPPFVFKYDKNFKEEKDKLNFLAGWSKFLTGRNRGKPGVLEYGMEIQPLGNSNEQNQFLETRKELQLDVARLWRIPPHKLGILDRATFSNIEQQSLEFVVDTLVPWLRLIERSIQKHIIVQDDVYFQFNTASLLRGDTKMRFESYQKARQWGWMSVNEIRALENLNGIGAQGDRYIEPLNMVEAGDERDDSERRDESRAMRVLHQTIPRISHHTADGLEAAEAIAANQSRPPNLRVVA